MSWPDIVWGAAILRGVDARARAELESAGTLREVRSGDVIFAAGAVADTFFVVIEGVVELRAPGLSEPVRRPASGETFGEEATLLAGIARAFDAICARHGRIAEVSATLFRRAVGRGGGASVAARVERAVRRAGARDVLRGIASSGLATNDLDAILDATQHHHLARGEPLFVPGEGVERLFVVADGMVSLRKDGRPRGHATRGHVFGGLGEDPALGAMAEGPSWVLSVPSRLATRLAPSSRRPLTPTSSFDDPFRLHTARSLLVIDQNACVRCGHCVWACATGHADGVARFERAGPTWFAGTGERSVPFLLPNACQHCASPSCLSECPTGAITRAPDGEVRLREDLCIGCGACAKACPWDNIQMAPRVAPGPEVASVERQVAVKCDLCQGNPAGPACVRACPVEAITRLTPSEIVRGTEPTKIRAWPWVTGAAAIAVAVAARAHHSPRLATGGIAGGLLIALVGYMAIKRLGHRRLRVPFVAHLVIGVLTIGAVLAHVGGRVGQGAAGGLHLAFWVATLAGILTALAGRYLPRRLTRLEQGTEAPSDGRTFEAEAFRLLSGQGEGLKAIYARILRPYARAPFGAFALMLSGRSVEDEAARLLAHLSTMLGGHGRNGLEGLVRLVVTERAAGGRRVLRKLLRVGLPVHVAATAVTLVLLVVHAVLSVWRP